ncbi:MAG: restriction endonuclease [Rhodocyclaceae bacterium]
MRPNITPTDYEIMVHEIHEALVSLDGVSVDKLKNINVRHDEKITGSSGVTHQIDIYWEFLVAGVLHKTCIECKKWNSRITKGDIAKFSAIIEDIGAKGVFVTTTGFQSGAEAFATYKKIRLLVINNIKDKGHIARFAIPIYKNLRIEFSEQVQDDFLLNITENSPIYNHDMEVVCDFNTLLQEPYDDGHYTHDISGKYFLIDNKLIEILKIEYDFESNTLFELKDQEYYAKAVIQDINSNKKFYFNFNGTITER